MKAARALPFFKACASKSWAPAKSNCLIRDLARAKSFTSSAEDIALGGWGRLDSDRVDRVSRPEAPAVASSGVASEVACTPAVTLPLLCGGGIELVISDAAF